MSIRLFLFCCLRIEVTKACSIHLRNYVNVTHCIALVCCDQCSSTVLTSRNPCYIFTNAIGPPLLKFHQNFNGSGLLHKNVSSELLNLDCAREIWGILKPVSCTGTSKIFETSLVYWLLPAILYLKTFTGDQLFERDYFAFFVTKNNIFAKASLLTFFLNLKSFFQLLTL